MEGGWQGSLYSSDCSAAKGESKISPFNQGNNAILEVTFLPLPRSCKDLGGSQLCLRSLGNTGIETIQTTKLPVRSQPWNSLVINIILPSDENVAVSSVVN